MAQELTLHAALNGARVEIGNHDLAAGTSEVDTKMQKIWACLVNMTTSADQGYCDLTITTHKVSVASAAGGTPAYDYMLIGI